MLLNFWFCISGSYNEAGPVHSGNADFIQVVPQINRLLDNLHQTKQHLNQLWHMKKAKLDQCYQLRLFEQDIGKVSFILKSYYLSFWWTERHSFEIDSIYYPNVKIEKKVTVAKKEKNT